MAIPQSSIIALSLMYTKLPPSASDLTYWASPAGQAVSWNQAVQAFSTSSQAKTAYPMLASPTVLSQNAAARRDYVTQAFQNLYGIAADAIPAAELTYWADTYLLSSPQAIFDFPVVLNQYSPAARQQALTNRAQVAENFAVAMAADGSSTFTSAQYSSGWVIVNTVTADAASVTAANAQIAQFIAGGGGGTGTTFTLLEQGAVLTASASSKVAPAGQFLNSSNNTVEALTFLPNSFVQDPSTADADVLTAQILGVGLVTPNITNIETIEFTGSTGAIADIVNISGVKNFVIKSGNLQVNTAEKFPLTLAAGYANQLSLKLNDTTKASTVNLNGTVAGTTIVDLNSAANVNIVVKADSVLKNSDATVATIKSVAGKNNFVISGDKNLTIDGKITVTDAADRLDATDFTGKLTLNLGKDSSIKQIVGGKSDDTFTLTAIDNQINGVNLNGNDGNDTLTVKVGASAAAINGVTNVETVVFKEAAANTIIATVDTLVASGATLTVDASSFTTKTLTFNGAAETNGSFKITGGAGVDVLTGGAKNDTLTGGGGLDILTGGGGNDQFVLNKAATGNGVTITDFTAVANNNDVFALSNAAFAGAPAVGATLAVSAVAGATNSANTILVDTFANLTANQTATSNVRFGYDTTGKQLFYDADGNFSAGTVLIATSTLAVNLNASNFAIVA
ncbi:MULTISPECIES: hemolysin [unclassified Microcystis]|uniref:beta strand repeat-containing protein n=2 Tax=Microcystis TaxID=1125 RepID=UPI002587D72E|nr:MULTISPECIES: hemolysin [unclassified Microcystis]MCA2642205.1 hemolysin [Microcystis sp. M087S2]MCA2764695.1 hemolysin [Microcystis sp. M151S2]MCA2670907.1 hemolysin [Microcystis sp. M080S2]MCA2687094.1 hemolysin [Microcystis sp. M037S2]MCA2734704.1 hemolysin [Microcystis sp. M158S2]